MNKKQIVRFVQSVIMLPLVATSLPYGITPASDTPLTYTTVLSVAKTENKNDPLEAKKALEIAKIEAYFRANKMPMADYAEKMVEEAYKNDIDPFLLPAIAVRESTGGKFACKRVDNSPFGWGSCRISFDTMNESIETVARNLGGKNTRTARYYAGKTTEQKLKAYNPDSIVPGYSKQVMAIMNKIDNHKVAEGTAFLISDLKQS